VWSLNNAGILAEVYHPLFAKVELNVREPWAWKGGALETFMKAAGVVPTYDDMRVILVSDVSAN